MSEAVFQLFALPAELQLMVFKSLDHRDLCALCSTSRVLQSMVEPTILKSAPARVEININLTVRDLAVLDAVLKNPELSERVPRVNISCVALAATREKLQHRTKKVPAEIKVCSDVENAVLERACGLCLSDESIQLPLPTADWYERQYNDAIDQSGHLELVASLTATLRHLSCRPQIAVAFGSTYNPLDASTTPLRFQRLGHRLFCELQKDSQMRKYAKAVLHRLSWVIFHDQSLFLGWNLHVLFRALQPPNSNYTKMNFVLAGHKSGTEVKWDSSVQQNLNERI